MTQKDMNRSSGRFQVLYASRVKREKENYRQNRVLQRPLPFLISIHRPSPYRRLYI